MDTLGVHFFGKIQNRIIVWDYMPLDSFLQKKRKIQKRIFPSIQLVACFSVKTEYHMDIFRILCQRNKKVMNPKNPD